MSNGRGSWHRRQRIKRALMATEKVCWLCLRPLDFGVADSRDPRYVVVDEELPVSKGGDPLDRANCHLVHNRCNGRKGSRILPRGAFASDPDGSGFALRPARTETRTSRKW